MMALAIALSGVALLLVTTDVGGGGGTGGGAQTGDGGPAGAPGAVRDGAIGAAARRFLDTYVGPDGRVERSDQGGDTVGEGQAYGMLLAAAIGDEQRFDLMWGWTKENMRRRDGLIAFLWRDGEIVDPKPASDADVDAARALLAASCRFERPELEAEALTLGRAILDHEIVTFRDTPLLVAGPWARTSPVTINPSYFSPATFAALGDLTGDARWNSLSASSRDVTGLLVPDEGRLPPDWAVIERGRPVASGPPAEPDEEPQYGFDAVRTLVRFAEDPDPAGREISARAWAAFEGRRPDQIPVEWTPSGRPDGRTEHPTALVAAAAAADAAGDAASKSMLLNAAEALDRRRPTYYGSAWVALGRVMLDTNALDCP